MKRIILAALFVLAGAVNAFGQSTTVSGQVTDSGAQAWNNGTYQFQFVPNPNFPTGPYTWTGGTLNRVISGSLNGSGAYSQSVPSNSAISPQGSKWILQVTPNATSSSFSTAATTITGGTQTVNVTPPAIAIPWQNPPGPAISAYADAEITGTLPNGAEYFNVTSGKTRLWNGSVWADQGGGGSSASCGTATATQILVGNTCVGSPSFTWTAATKSLSAVGGATSSLVLDVTGVNKTGLQCDITGCDLASIDAGGQTIVQSNSDMNILTQAGNMFLNSAAGLALTAAFNINLTSNQTTVGLAGGGYIAHQNIPFAFISSVPSSGPSANQKSPPFGIAASTWTGGTSQNDGYFLEAVPDTGTNPIVRVRLLHDNGTFFTARAGGSVLDIGAAGQGGTLRLAGNTSGIASIGAAAVAGTPNQMNLPTTTGTAGQFLQTDGANPQQLTWATVSGGISGLTTSKIPKAASSTTIADSALDDGLTTANTLTYTGSGGITASAGPLKAGLSGGVGGTLTLPEGTAATASAGNDVLYADSTSHTVKAALNNGSFLNIPLFSGAFTSGHCLQASGTVNLIVDSGGTCGGSLPAHLTYADPTLTVSAATFGNAQVALSGNTSGTATFTAPAVAGTVSNAVTMSNVLSGPVGASGGATYTAAGQAGAGLYFVGGQPCLTGTSADVCINTGSLGGPIVRSDGGIAFSTTSDPSAGAFDTAMFRDAAGIFKFGKTFGTSTAGLKLSYVQSAGTKFTASGCSNSATVGGASAGQYTSGTTGTCTVTITMGDTDTATNGWACFANDLTTVADTQKQSASTTTTATITGTTVSGDVINFGCTAY
jgi:hypothetical protein